MAMAAEIAGRRVGGKTNAFRLDFLHHRTAISDLAEKLIRK